ncbi:50S ribosomal protein L4 [Methanospirillum stamsii]|uniref:Large ribosomal subunit protein uL4 n=1 Tax=Methanospirillum stamsii TaxID=1277351 RepID=A0A2V2MZJ3_9EURY|nr:50S ribosomal protein L4 [Methanospirillum stamsii]PWR73564.1 50S ribosomal protein L4 [Methanospirillum stamsii]
MKAQVLTLTGTVAHEIDLPSVFSSEYRPDLIKKAVIAQQSRRYQPHGAYPYAGISASAVGWGSGRGVSHVPRLKNSSRAAKVPQAKGGREAHPPKVEKILVRAINQKEKRKAINSAIAATISDELVRSRGHVFSGSLPFVLSGEFESLKKTKEVITALRAIGVYGDVERAERSRKVRAGRGKLRGRRYKQRKSLLIVTANENLRAAKNLAGVDVCLVDNLNVELLAPGTHAARLTLWTEDAVKKLGGEQ